MMVMLLSYDVKTHGSTHADETTIQQGAVGFSNFVASTADHSEKPGTRTSTGCQNPKFQTILMETIRLLIGAHRREPWSRSSQP